MVPGGAAVNGSIGGFDDGHGADPVFRKFLVRWFEFAVFSPVCRLHGLRDPNGVQPSPAGETMGDGPRDMFFIFTDSRSNNAASWYGPEVLAVAARLLRLRERLRPYLREAMLPLAYDVPGDPAAEAPHQCIFGPDILVAPVFEPGATTRRVRLPEGGWVHAFAGSRHGPARPRSPARRASPRFSFVPKLQPGSGSGQSALRSALVPDERLVMTAQLD